MSAFFGAAAECKLFLHTVPRCKCHCIFAGRDSTTCSPVEVARSHPVAPQLATYALRRQAFGRFFSAQGDLNFQLHHLLERTAGATTTAASTNVYVVDAVESAILHFITHFLYMFIFVRVERYPRDSLIRHLQCAVPVPVAVADSNQREEPRARSTFSRYRCTLPSPQKADVGEAIALAVNALAAATPSGFATLPTRYLLASAECLIFRVVNAKESRTRLQTETESLGASSESSEIDSNNKYRKRNALLKQAKQYLKLFSALAMSRDAISKKLQTRRVAQCIDKASDEELFLYTLLRAMTMDLEGDLSGSMQAMRQCASFFKAVAKIPKHAVFQTFLARISLKQIKGFGAQKTTSTVLKAVRQTFRMHRGNKGGIPRRVQQKILAMFLSQFAVCTRNSQTQLPSNADEAQDDIEVADIDDLRVEEFRRTARLIDDFLDRRVALPSQNTGTKNITSAQSADRKKRSKSELRKAAAAQRRERRLTALDIFFGSCGTTGRTDIALLLASTLLRTVQHHLPHGAVVVSPAEGQSPLEELTPEECDLETERVPFVPLSEIGQRNKHFERPGQRNRCDSEPENARGCEICGGTDHEDLVLLCDGAMCNHLYQSDQTPVREYHMYCLYPHFDSVPDGDFIGPCCAPEEWATRAAAASESGRPRGTPPPNSVAEKRRAETAAAAAAAVASWESAKSLQPPDLGDMSESAAVTFVTFLVNKVVSCLQDDLAFNSSLDTANDGASSTATIDSAKTFASDAPQIELARAEVRFVLLCGMNVAWLTLDQSILEACWILARYTNCEALYLAHMNVRTTHCLLVSLRYCLMEQPRLRLQVTFSQIIGHCPEPLADLSATPSANGDDTPDSTQAVASPDNSEVIAASLPKRELVTKSIAITLGLPLPESPASDLDAATQSPGEKVSAESWGIAGLRFAWRQAVFAKFLGSCFERLSESLRVVENSSEGRKYLTALTASVIFLLQIYHRVNNDRSGPFEITFRHGVAFALECHLRTVGDEAKDVTAASAVSLQNAAKTVAGLVDLLCRTHNASLSKIIHVGLTVGLLDLYGKAVGAQHQAPICRVPKAKSQLTVPKLSLDTLGHSSDWRSVGVCMREMPAATKL